MLLCIQSVFTYHVSSFWPPCPFHIPIFALWLYHFPIAMYYVMILKISLRCHKLQIKWKRTLPIDTPTTSNSRTFIIQPAVSDPNCRIGPSRFPVYPARELKTVLLYFCHVTRIVIPITKGVYKCKHDMRFKTRVIHANQNTSWFFFFFFFFFFLSFIYFNKTMIIIIYICTWNNSIFLLISFHKHKLIFLKQASNTILI